MKDFLQFKDVSYFYQTKENEVQALDKINFSVDEEEFASLVGPSGCGKTTILSLTAGLLEPSSGQILLQGSPIKKNDSRIGYMFQRDHLFEWRSIWQNIKLGLEVQKKNKDEKSLAFADELLRKYDLYNFKNKKPRQLSGGMRQRVALIRTLVLKPALLLLDEPFSALDAHLKSALEQDLQKLFERFEGSILYVSHDIDEAFRFCDRIAVVSEGHLEEIDTKDRIITDPQTLATIRLSGCKNTTEAIYVDEHHAFLPKWNISITSTKPLDPEIKYCGMRAKFIEYADDAASLNPDEAPIKKSTELSANTYWIRVEHVSDSRFERTVLITFLQGKELETIQKNETFYTETGNNAERNNNAFSNLYGIRTGSLDLTEETEITPIQWHINKLTTTRPLPEAGDLCKVTLNPRGLYFVNR